MATLQSQQEAFSHHPILTPPGEFLACCDYSRRRIFIGPMPEKETSDTDLYSDNRKLTQQIKSWLHSSAEGQNEDEESFISVLLRRAYQDFLRQDGRMEDWGQESEAAVRQGIWKRWQESKWGGSLQHRRRDAPVITQRWVGGSFEVGNVLGVNILDNPTASFPQDNHTCFNDKHDGPSTGDPPFVPSGQSTRAEIALSPTNSHAPPSQNSTQEVLGEPSQFSSVALLNAGVAPASEDLRSTHNAPMDGSQQPILKGKKSSTHTSVNERRASFFIAGGVTTPSDYRTASSLDKGKSRDLNQGTTAEVDDVPAPPAAILARSGNDVDETSAGVTLEVTPSREEFTPEDIRLRGWYLAFLYSYAWLIVLLDRMLVRVSYTESESLPRHFDEVQNRMTANLKYEDWAEFLVVWRGKRLELYEDYVSLFLQPAAKHEAYPIRPFQEKSISLDINTSHS